MCGFGFYLFTDSATLNSIDTKLQLEHLDSTNQVICDTIFEVIKSDDNHFVAARQKHQFTVFYLQSENVQQDFKCEHRIPFISGTFVENNFYSIDANRTMQRFNLATKQEYGRMHLKKAKNNSFWCQLKSYNNQIVYVDESKLKIYDSRLFSTKASKCMELNIDSITEKCEGITCIRADADEQNLYIGATHNLFVFDVRYGTESTNQLTRYTHQMNTPPFVIDACGGGATGATANERLILSCGTFTDDIVTTQHSKLQNDKVRTNNIPQRILTMTDAIQNIQENGLYPSTNGSIMDNRSINVGSCFSRIDSELYLLSEKSSGEIFYQKIMQKENHVQRNLDDKPLRDDNLLCSNSYSSNRTKATTVTNFDSIKRILSYTLPDECDLPDIDNPKPKKWQKSMEQLASYKDMLSADLLNVWNERIQPLPVDDKTNKTELVSSWIKRTSNVSTMHSEGDEDQSLN